MRSVRIAALLGLLVMLAWAFLPPAEPHLPTQARLRSIAIQACTTDLTDAAATLVRQRLNPEHPEAVELQTDLQSCAFHFEDKLSRSDLIGYGAALSTADGLVIQLYSAFDHRLTQDDRPSFVIIPSTFSGILWQ